MGKVSAPRSDLAMGHQRFHAKFEVTEWHR
jgi:hypothetical protein